MASKCYYRTYKITWQQVESVLNQEEQNGNEFVQAVGLGETFVLLIFKRVYEE